MLPVILYEPDEAVREGLAQALTSMTSGSDKALKLLIKTGSFKDAESFLKDEKGILLLLAGVMPLDSDDKYLALKLGRHATAQNRDNYTLFFLHNAKDLERVINTCLRPAGVLISPLVQKKALAVLQKILEDYARLCDESDERQVILHVGSTVHRIPIRRILYVEANDKKVLFWMSHQCISVYDSLSNIANLLGSDFLRCHRSCLINRDAIASTNFAAMELTLKNDVKLPISRSCRDAVREALE